MNSWIPRWAVSWLAALLITPVSLSASLEGAEPKDTPKMQLWVPAYYYPFGKGLKEWDRLIGSAQRAPIVAIVNPDSGPGNKPDTNYAAIIPRAKKAGITLVGYVGTKYTKRPLEEVKAEVDKWVRFYPEIQGIHFDEQTSEAAKVDYFVALYQHVRKKLPKGRVLSNPGTDCAEDYVARPAADVVCLFEKDKGFDRFRLPAWSGRYTPNRFAAQAYQVDTPEKMEGYVRQAALGRIGFIFITDAKGANPYDRLPSYWEAEVAAVERVNQSK